MKKNENCNQKIGWLYLLIFISAIFIPAISTAEPFIIDHTSTELSQIPVLWIDAAQANIKTYYAHTSHGRQLTIGLERIAASDSTYAVAIGENTLPGGTDRLCIFDYIGATPNYYWSSPGGIQQTRDVLNNNPAINVSMWAWCGEPAEMSAAEVQEYLDVLAGFEAANPGVIFIYMTGHAQFDGSEGYNRYLRNEQIRTWVRNSASRVLFDFADLDSWWFNTATLAWEQATYVYGNTSVPVEHPQFHDPSGPGHTTYESCEQKGRALWWMMAGIAGWITSGEINQPPMADAGEDQLVSPGETVTLDGSKSIDPDGEIVSYTWNQTVGPAVLLSDKASVAPTFIVTDDIPDTTSLMFELTVFDQDGLSDSDRCIVNVTDSDQPPIADAGEDQSASPGDTITLDGSGSIDPDGEIASYLWEQVSGSGVVLSDSSAITSTFTAPEIVSNQEILVFELLVADAVGLLMSDNVMITIQNTQITPEQSSFIYDSDDNGGICFISLIKN